MPLNLSYADFSARPVTIADAEMMLEWRNRDAVREGMFHSRKISIEDQIPWLQGRIDAPDSFYYIFQHKDRPMGVFGVYDIDTETGIGEWVFYMGPGAPDMPRGAGAAMEFLALDIFFGTHKLRRLIGRTLKTNARVWRMHERFGFTVEGCLREHILKDGEYIDLIYVGMFAREWQEKRTEQYQLLFAPDPAQG
jgi:UDP-4-amino-4,6-dideoxy-N-acetyl-beta-L-altrosamine N-acetyltransferase